MNNILYFASKYLKRTFEKKPYEFRSIKYGLVLRYLLNTVQYVQHCASNYLKRTFEKKSHKIASIKYGPAMKYLLNTVQ